MTWKHHVKSLKTLLKLDPQLQEADDRTLSLYLPVRAEGFDAAHYEILLKNLAKPYRYKLEEEQQRIFDAEMLRLKTHLNLRRPAGCPALVAFANEPKSLLTLIRLPESVEARVALGEILLGPLELLLKRYPPAVVVVVDKKEARTYAWVLGEVVPLEHVKGPWQEVKHIRSGGTSAPSNQRKADNRMKANVERVVAILEREVTRGDFERIFVAGPEEPRAELMHDLPKQLSGRVVGTLSASLDTLPGKLQEEIRAQMVRLGRVSSAA